MQLLHEMEAGSLVLHLFGRIDSGNAQEIEQAIAEIRDIQPSEGLVLDCGDLTYISSAGLRVILRLKKAVDAVSLINVSSEVYEILEMTGFTEMLEVRKAFRMISVEGCEVIGQGANGIVCRIDPETVVKVYRNPDALSEIRRERELARTAFILGIPTAIPYDVVRIEGGGYGSVYELLDAVSLCALVNRGRISMEQAAEQSIGLLKTIHSTTVKPGSVPDMRTVALDWADFLKEHLDPALHEKLRALLSAMPEDLHMLHGDFHLKNILLQNGEALLIDMDSICCGHPVFELAFMYNAYVAYGETDSTVTPAFFGFPQAESEAFWNRCLHLYLEGADEATLRSVEEKAAIVGYARAMRRRIRRGGCETATGRAEIENCRRHLAELLPKHDTLLF